MVWQVTHPARVMAAASPPGRCNGPFRLRASCRGSPGGGGASRCVAVFPGLMQRQGQGDHPLVVVERNRHVQL
jgi:hypothetical protein